jgi:hypothetical protein
MAFKSNTTTVLDTTGFSVANFTTGTRPANPVTGQVIYNTTIGLLEIYDNGIWKDATQNISGGAFLYRQIITTSYVAGGYKDTSPWRNVNRMVHATDIMTNLGDLLSITANYTSGANNLTRAFMWGALAGATIGGSNQTVAYNMITETGAGLNSSWNMTVSRDDSGTIFKENQYAYITGGGSSAVDVFNLTTETMLSAGAVAGQAGDSGFNYGVSAFSDESVGYWWGSSGQKLTFATGSTYTVAAAANASTNGQQKGISSKLGRGYMGNEGNYNGGYNLRRYVVSTDTYTTIAKPIGNSGEENFDMGQSWQYKMGGYDGAQNNRGWKFTYSTDTGIELGAGSVRTGVPGGSSGHCAWRG